MDRLDFLAGEVRLTPIHWFDLNVTMLFAGGFELRRDAIEGAARVRHQDQDNHHSGGPERRVCSLSPPPHAGRRGSFPRRADPVLLRVNLVNLNPLCDCNLLLRERAKITRANNTCCLPISFIHPNEPFRKSS
jgi:hypothetical protein